MTLILFETFNVSAIYVAIQAVLSLCGSLHRDETCLPFRLKRLFRWANSAVPVATVTSADPLAPVFPVCYVAPAPVAVVDTTRLLQWCLLLHQRLLSIRRASSRGVFCCTSACVATLAAPAMYAAHGPVVVYTAPVSYAATVPIVEHISPVPAGSYLAPEPVVDTTRPSNMSRLLPQCTRRQRLWWRTSRSLQPCRRHKRLWWSTSRPLQPCTRHQRLW